MKDFLFNLLKKAGSYALEKQSSVFGYQKDDDSVVTEVDLFLSNFIKEKINEYALEQNLDFCIVDEEKENSFEEYLSKEYAFIIDPIDGTMNYSNGHVLWGISIGIFKNQKPFAGGVYLPAINKIILTDGYKIFALYKAKCYEVEQNKVNYHGKNKTIAITNGSLYSIDINTPFIASENCTVSHMFFVNYGVHIGAIQRVKLWDTAASLSIGQVLNNFGWSLDGKKMEVFDKENLNEDFSHKEHFVFSSEEFKTEILESIVLK